MVKGTSKRIIVVKSPDPKIFEQAIFIVREDFGSNHGEKQSDVLKEAQKVANEYIKCSVSGTRRILSRIPPFGFAAAGAALTGIAWLTLKLFGI